MARDHYISPTVPEQAAVPVRLGAGNAEGDRYDYKEVGKFVKLVGESRYALTVAGDLIEAAIFAVELAPQNGYTIGSVQGEHGTRLSVTFDGLQATPGTGTVAVGDYVVTGTVTAKGTILPGYPKVTKATIQPGVTEAADAAAVNDHINATKFMWRVVSLGTVGTGAVGTTGVIERI